MLVDHQGINNSMLALVPYVPLNFHGIVAAHGVSAAVEEFYAAPSSQVILVDSDGTAILLPEDGGSPAAAKRSWDQAFTSEAAVLDLGAHADVVTRRRIAVPRSAGMSDDVSVPSAGNHRLGSGGYFGKQAIWDKEDAEVAKLGK